MTKKGGIERFNERVALWGTKAFGNMWMCYLFIVWGLIGIAPLFGANFRELVLMISSGFIQLWALPLLQVGTNLQGKKSERLIAETNKIIKSEFEDIKFILESQKAEMAFNKEILDLLKKILDRLPE